MKMRGKTKAYLAHSVTGLLFAALAAFWLADSLTRAQTEIANAIHYDEHLVNVEVGPCAASLYTIIQYHIQYGRE